MFSEFAITDESRFSCRELGRLREQGLGRWILSQDGFAFEDSPFDVDGLPVLLRTAMLAGVVEHLPALSYALPYRGVGRCLLFAILPQPAPKTVEIMDEWPRLVDPPIPFFVMDAISPVTATLHARNVARFLRSGDRRWIEGQALWTVVEEIARAGSVSKSELGYYLINMQALATGAWRFVKENAKLVEIEEMLLRVGQPVNPARAQAAAYAYLVANEPFRLGGR